MNSQKFTYIPEAVCSRQINFEIDAEGKLRNLSFIGGCSGNTQGVCALAEGRSANEVAAVLRGLDCKGRGTSCPDQLARAISEAMNQKIDS